MRIPLENIKNKPLLECLQCGSNWIMEGAETRRFNGPFCINFFFKCENCNMGFLLKSNKRISEESHQILKRDGFDVVINPNHETRAVNGNPVHEIDCQIKLWATGEEIEY